MKLVQKQFLKGSREFEILDDTVFVRIKSLFKEEKITVRLDTLDPEPVNNGSELVFYSHYKGRPVMSLLLNKPNSREFNNFIAALKLSILGEDETPVNVNASRADALRWNVYEEPPEFGEPDQKHEQTSFPPVKAERIDTDISMLKTYLNADDIRALLDALEALKAEPENKAAFQKMMDAFNALGINQGAVLTYAPYLKVLISQSLWS